MRGQDFPPTRCCLFEIMNPNAVITGIIPLRRASSHTLLQMLSSFSCSPVRGNVVFATPPLAEDPLTRASHNCVCGSHHPQQETPVLPKDSTLPKETSRAKKTPHAIRSRPGNCQYLLRRKSRSEHALRRLQPRRPHRQCRPGPMESSLRPQRKQPFSNC